MSNGLEKRLSRLEQELERRELARRPRRLTQFDEDALWINKAAIYLDATTATGSNDIVETAAYLRGGELHDALYGPIIPAHLNKHFQRLTQASAEFQFAFGREPRVGDMLCYEHVARVHSSEKYSRELGRIIEAWLRQLPQFTCPLKYEDGRLFRLLAPKSRGEDPRWEEHLRIQPQERWLSLAEVESNSDFEAGRIVSALVFQGVVGGKHQCRPATEEDLQQPATEH